MNVSSGVEGGSAMQLSDIPSAEEPPADDGTPSAMQKELNRRQLSRHTLTRMVADRGMSLGLAAVGALAPGGVEVMAVGTEYLNCTVYNYDDGSSPCFGGVVSSSYCGGDKWHREDDHASGNCPYWYLNSLPTRCNGRGAWRWVRSGLTYRCADGELWYRPCGAANWSHYYTICSALL